MNDFHPQTEIEPEAGVADPGYAPNEPVRKPSRDWRDRCYAEPSAAHYALLAQRLLRARARAPPDANCRAFAATRQGFLTERQAGRP